MSKFYVTDGDIAKLTDFLATRPDGVIRILLSDTDSPVQKLLSALTHDSALGVWVKDKITDGTLTFMMAESFNNHDEFVILEKD